MHQSLTPLKPVMEPISNATEAKANGINGTVNGVDSAHSSKPTRAEYRGGLHLENAPLEKMDESVTEDNAGGSGASPLQIQIRTRDTGRGSPLVTTPTLLMGKSSATTFNPYGSEVSTPVGVGVHREFSSVHDPRELLQEPLPSMVVHSALYGKCRFIEFPSLAPVDPLPPPPQGGSFSLFIGQVRFETTPAELIWLFRRTSGARAITVEGRGSGCFILHLRSESERALVRQLHKRILFDIGGVWFARTSEEVDSLCEHVALYGPYLSKQAKLPRDSMVVEEIKIDSVDMPYCHPLYYSQTSPSHSFGGSSGAWPHSNSRLSTPLQAPHYSNPPSPLSAPAPPVLYSGITPHDIGESYSPWDFR